MNKALALVIVLSAILIGGLVYLSQQRYKDAPTVAPAPPGQALEPDPVPSYPPAQPAPLKPLNPVEHKRRLAKMQGIAQARQALSQDHALRVHRAPCEGDYSPVTGTNFGRCVYTERVSYEAPGGGDGGGSSDGGGYCQPYEPRPGS